MRIKAKSSENIALIRKAQKRGWEVALFNGQRPSLDQIKARNPDYTDEHAQAYLKAYDAKAAKMKGTDPDNNALIRQAQKQGGKIALRNTPRPTHDQVKARNSHYTDEQVQAYLNAYDAKVAKMKAAGTQNKALIKQAQNQGNKVALFNGQRPTQDQIKARHPDYTDEQFQAYLNAYDAKRAQIKASGTENKALMRRAKKQGSEAASSYGPRPTEDNIKTRHPDYIDEQVQAYLNAYDAKRAKRKTNGTFANELSNTFSQLKKSEDYNEIEQLPQTPTAFLYNFARTNAGPSLLNNNYVEEVAFVFSPLTRPGQ